MYLNDFYIMFAGLCGVVWGGVVWCGAAWCGVVWRVTVFIVDDGFVN